MCRSCLCFVPACDDGFADPGEECGEPTLAACPAGDVCTSGCVCGPPVCGNGDAEPGETCGEPGLDCPMGQACDPEACICLPAPSCGDDTADPGEQCGEPTLAACPATDECLNCVCTALCGNGRVDPDETCGEMGLSCAAGQTCAGCRCVSPCGNGTVDPGEECDPANTAPGAPPGAPTCTSSVYCSARCIVEARPRVCGNGCQDLTETCGEPGLPANCGANPCEDCHCPNPCGNGVLDEGEACDGTLFSEGCGLGVGGGGRPVRYCTSSCECDFSVCRDGFVEGPEQCEWTCDKGCDVSSPCANALQECDFFTCGCEFPVCGDGVHGTGEYDTCDTISDPCGPGQVCTGSEDGQIYCFCNSIDP
ncbi:MAG: hypothetical protein IT379_08635 [Deltaproteobacteria bacterium]|nr:hypothetical protein [Deltaproteobacteria bacterium]